MVIEKTFLKRAIALMSLAVLTACGSEVPRLMNVTSDGTPDEFAILPNKPIQIPQNVAALPAPTPGQANRVDPTPRGDAVAALGGNPGALVPTGVVRGDPGTLSYATRYGVTPGIRTTLAAEDLEYRRRNDGRLLERLFKQNLYYDAYAPYSLDQYRELERIRRAGIRTVSAPPPPQ